MHPLTHDVGTTGFHAYIARQAGMTAQLKACTGFHGYIHGGIRIVPVIQLHETICICSRCRPHAMNCIAARQHNLAIADDEPTGAVVTQIRVDTVQIPDSISLIIYGE